MSASSCFQPGVSLRFKCISGTASWWRGAARRGAIGVTTCCHCYFPECRPLVLCQFFYPRPPLPARATDRVIFCLASSQLLRFCFPGVLLSQVRRAPPRPAPPRLASVASQAPLLQSSQTQCSSPCVFQVTSQRNSSLPPSLPEEQEKENNNSNKKFPNYKIASITEPPS